jgi:hypothetical protein
MTMPSPDSVLYHKPDLWARQILSQQFYIWLYKIKHNMPYNTYLFKMTEFITRTMQVKLVLNLILNAF